MGRSWRLAATGFAFAVFGAGAVLVTTTALPAIALRSRDPARRQRLARSCIRAAFRAFVALLQFLRIVKIDVDADTVTMLAAERGTVVVANHPSFLDVLVLVAHIDQASCVVKEAVWRNPLLSRVVRMANYIPSGDPEALLLASERTLRRKETLIVFPEATRSLPGRPIRLQRGAANIALRADATLRFVHFSCEPPLLAKGDRWYHVPKQQPCLAMRAGGSVRARDFLLAGQQRNAAARRLTRALQRELSRDTSADERLGTRAQAAVN